MRDFVRRKSGRALFIEYDIAVGSRAAADLPGAPGHGHQGGAEPGPPRPGRTGSVFFVMDEFALLPQLTHISDGINFGRSLGLKFLVGTQNVNQVRHAYGGEAGASILSGFGTVFAFRLMDDSQPAAGAGTVRAQPQADQHLRRRAVAGMQQVVVDGNVIEDWHLSGLGQGQCLVSLPERPAVLLRRREVPGARPAVVGAAGGSRPVSAAGGQGRAERPGSLAGPARPGHGPSRPSPGRSTPTGRGPPGRDRPRTSSGTPERVSRGPTGLHQGRAGLPPPARPAGRRGGRLPGLLPCAAPAPGQRAASSPRSFPTRSRAVSTSCAQRSRG